MDNTYKIRTYRIQDRADVLELIATVWQESSQEAIPKIWDWKIEKNPYNSVDKLGLVLEHDGHVVGLISAMNVSLKIHERVTTANWLSDYAVHPDHRGRGGLILRQYMKNPEFFLVSPNEISGPIVKRLRFGDIYTLLNMVYIKNLRSAIKDMVVSTNFLFPVQIVWDIILKGIFQINKLYIKKSVSISKISSFDEKFDVFWDRVASDYKNIVVRDRKYLKWKYIDRPDKTYQIYMAESDGNISGYIVFRDEVFQESRYGHIVDFLVKKDDPDSFRMLISKAVGELNKRNVDLITCYVSPYCHFHRKTLKKSGFFFSKNRRQLMYLNNIQGISKEEVSNPEDWFFTRGDHDLDMYYF